MPHFNTIPIILILFALAVLVLFTWKLREDIKSWFDQRFTINPFRLLLCGAAAVCCLAVVSWLSPVQLPVTVYKLSLVLLAGYLGYWLDVWFFPYARPNGYLARNWQTAPGFKSDLPDHAVVSGYELVFAAAMLRRALIVGLCMLAMGLGM